MQAAGPVARKGSRPSLAIVAGGGSLPRSLAEHCKSRGDSYRLFAVREAAGAWAETHAPLRFGLGEVPAFLAALASSGCREVCFAGSVPRPSVADLGGNVALSGALAPIADGLRKGDDALLRIVAGIVEAQGVRVIGVEERLPELLAPVGTVIGAEPDERSLEDVCRGAEIVRALGMLDVGQAAVVAEGRCLAVEAIEGTQALLARVAGMGPAERGGAARGRGVLVKAPKPGQDLRLDRPAVGPETLEAASSAGLCGVAVAAGEVLLLEPERFAERKRTADRVFLYGFARQES